MKRLVIATLAALSLSACAALGALSAVAPMLGNVPTSPATVANGTVLDERGAIAVESAYKGFRTVLEALVDGGLLTGARATQAAAIDNRAYAAVKVARAAYRSGNAASYAAAVTEARKAIADGLGVLKG